VNKELIVNASPSKVEIALLENSKLVELHQQRTKSNFSVGDIFIGRIKKLMPGLNAAFVDIGHRKDAFLHYTDLGPKLRTLLRYSQDCINKKRKSHLLEDFIFEPEIIKTGKVDQVLEKRQPVLVQVLKEPISTKGPRLSCEITIPGRFMVLTPFSNVVAVSKKITTSEERKRLNTLVESIRPKNFGIIVRTAAEGKKVADLHEELRGLIQKWEQLHKQLGNSLAEPQKLLSELDKTSSILRDVLNESFNSIVVNDRELYTNIKNFLSTIAPDKIKILSLHKSRKPIFEAYGVNRQIKSSFGKTSTMSTGAYLVIESTEAMHVVDVNSGPKMQKKDQETSAIAVNLEAAEEIARQLRLRDIGGLIIIDFIDMRSQENKQMLVSEMRTFMKKDHAQHTILPLSKFGLMQITRQRVKPEVKIDTSEECPTCNGSGKINPTVIITEEIERDLEFILSSRPNVHIKLHAHPFVHAFLKRGIPSIHHRWYFKYLKWIKIIPNNDFGIREYKFFDKNNDEIRLG
jgi:ribonuclease G